MMRIAVVFEGDVDNRFGVFNAVRNRVLYLRKAAGDEAVVDVFLVNFYDGRVSRMFRRGSVSRRNISTADIGGVEVEMLWFKRSLLDSLCHRVFNARPWFYGRFCKRLARRLADYDIVSAHDMLGGMVGAAFGHLTGKPYYVTWHGGSINTNPWRDSQVRSITCDLLRGARCNFSVSEAQCEVARRLVPDCTIVPLLNGIGSEFVKFADVERELAREHYHVPYGARVVAFLGRVDEDKRVLLLPGIFTEITSRYGGEVVYWIIGDGPQFEELKSALGKTALNAVLWGRKKAEEIPAMLNCVDVLVLPSRMEGLPLVAAEAIACGANVVGSRVGGIPEVIGEENTFSHGADFNVQIAARAVEMLEGKVAQHVPESMSWERTAMKELAIYREAKK